MIRVTSKARQYSAALALVAIALSCVSAFAGATASRDSAKISAATEQARSGEDQWRPANGAEILAGFAGPNDEINQRTGETRSR